MLRKFIFNYKNQINQIAKYNKQYSVASVEEETSKRNASEKHASDDVVVHLEQSHIDEAIKLEPALSKHTLETWQRTHSTFTGHGLTTVSFLRIAVGNPMVLTRSPQKNYESIERWRSCQFGEKLLYLLIVKYPELLNISDQRVILQQMAVLKSYFASNKNVWKVLMNCPDLIQQSEKTIDDKINYIRNVMRIEIPEIVKSCALSKSLEEIQCRHVFLERLSLFTPRPLKADPNEPTKNHRLYQIVDASEKSFATKICHVTLDEFEAFKELYARELERKREASEEFDSDGE